MDPSGDWELSVYSWYESAMDPVRRLGVVYSEKRREKKTLKGVKCTNTESNHEQVLFKDKKLHYPHVTMFKIKCWSGPCGTLVIKNE